MPTDGFASWFRDAEKRKKNEIRRAPQKQKQKTRNRKRNKQARASRKKNR